MLNFDPIPFDNQDGTTTFCITHEEKMKNITQTARSIILGLVALTIGAVVK